jgi:tetratricopeptide (TPR) repeat protein
MGSVLALWASSGEAAKAYESGAYEEAYHAYDRLFRTDMADVSLSFYLGRSAYETGRFDEAVSAYERVLISQPNNLRARLELGRSYFALKMYAPARGQFERVLQNPLPPTVRANIERYLAHIDQQMRKHFLSGSMMAGLQYDSNVRNQSGSVFDIGAIEDAVMSEEEASASWLLGGGVSHLYNPQNGGPLRWQSGAQLHLQDYTDVDDAGVNFLSLKSGPQWRLNSWSVSVPLQVDYLHYAGESYLLTPGLSLRAEKMIAAGQMAGVSYRYQQRLNQIDANKNRDAAVHHLMGHYQQMLKGGAGAFNLSSGFIRTRKKSGEAKDVSTDTLSLQGGYLTRISPALNANFSLTVRQVNYPDKPPKVSDDLNPHDRADLSLSAAASLAYTLREKLFLQGSLSVTQNDSNDDYYDYDKQVIGLNLLHTF